MTYVDVMEAIAAKVAALWPKRMIYRDFCPVDHRRPSSFLYVQEAGYTDAALGLVQWNFTASLELFAETDDYSVESTEQLRQDQASVLALFGGPALEVGDRSILVSVFADAPGPGVAIVNFSASWIGERPCYKEQETAPLMEDFAINMTRKD